MHCRLTTETTAHRVLIASLALLGLLWVLPPCQAVAQSDAEVQALAEDMRPLVAVRTPRGPVPVRHCRSAGPPVEGGDVWARCDRRLYEFARYFVASGRAHGVDSLLLAAMARHESGLNPFAESSIGSRGIGQLHPRGVGRRSIFVRSDRFWAACAREIGACQREIVDLQAEHLRAWIDRCGEVKAALGGYNSGRCGRTRYMRSVLRWHNRIRGLRGSDA